MRVLPQFVLTSLLQYLSKNSRVARSSLRTLTSAAQSRNQISLAPSQSRTTSTFSLTLYPAMRRRETRPHASLPRSPLEPMLARCVWPSYFSISPPNLAHQILSLLYLSSLSLPPAAAADESTHRDAPARVPQPQPMEVEDPTLYPQEDQ